MTAPLRHPPANFVRDWLPLDEGDIVSRNPARPDEIVWHGASSTSSAEDAVNCASRAQGIWGSFPIEKRIEALRAFQSIAKERVEEAADLICRETGKAHWDARAEAGLLAGKIDITLAEGAHTGRSRVEPFEVPLTETRRGACHFRPHGPLVVLGPFNFPMHLPNGHIAPALLMGNTVIFKPSDKTPACGQLLAEMYIDALSAAGAPPGTFSLVQGGAQIAQALMAGDVGGILFTGSWPVGRKILEANLDRPERMVALELGGNNAALVMPDADLKQAAIECARAAFVTTGQRCTCTRRIIVHDDVADRFINLLTNITRTITVGNPLSDPPVFMGPIITAEARDAVLEFQGSADGDAIVESRALDLDGEGHYLTPGIMAVDHFSWEDSGHSNHAGRDVEIFGPLVRVARTSEWDHAMANVNCTRYGLAASIFTQDAEAQRRFMTECRAGCINVNTGTAGASGKLPFGGIGRSGNHRPAGAYALDYCAYPVASMIETGDAAPTPPGMTWDDTWL